MSWHHLFALKSCPSRNRDDKALLLSTWRFLLLAAIYRTVPSLTENRNILSKYVTLNISIYVLTRRRGADTAHTQMGRPPVHTRHLLESTHTNTHTNTNKHTTWPDKVRCGRCGLTRWRRPPHQRYRLIPICSLIPLRFLVAVAPRLWAFLSSMSIYILPSIKSRNSVEPNFRGRESLTNTLQGPSNQPAVTL